jgi:hypothetical protein
MGAWGRSHLNPMFIGSCEQIRLHRCEHVSGLTSRADVDWHTDKRGSME